MAWPTSWAITPILSDLLRPANTTEESLMRITAPVISLPENLFGIVTAKTFEPLKLSGLLLQAITIPSTGGITVAAASTIQSLSVGAHKRPVLILSIGSVNPPFERRIFEVGTLFQKLSLAGVTRSFRS